MAKSEIEGTFFARASSQEGQVFTDAPGGYAAYRPKRALEEFARWVGSPLPAAEAARLREKVAELKARVHELFELTQRASDDRHARESAEGEAEQLRDRLAQQATTIANRDARIKNARAEGHRLREANERLREERASWHDRCLVAEKRLADRDETIGSLRAREAAHDVVAGNEAATIKGLREQVAELERQWDTRHRVAVERREEIKRLRDELGMARHAATAQRKAKMLERMKANRLESALAAREKVVEAACAYVEKFHGGAWGWEAPEAVAFREVVHRFLNAKHKAGEAPVPEPKVPENARTVALEALAELVESHGDYLLTWAGIMRSQGRTGIETLLLQLSDAANEIPAPAGETAEGEEPATVCADCGEAYDFAGQSCVCPDCHDTFCPACCRRWRRHTAAVEEAASDD